MNAIDFSLSKYYINRELSWVEFNQRVLDEACNHDNPLFERFKFLSIVSSNLDEYFMVRVASIKDQVDAGFDKADFSGLKPKDILAQLNTRIHKLVNDQYNQFNKSIAVSLEKNGFNILEIDDLNQVQERYVKEYFNDIIYPVLTPMAVDSSRPFPLIFNKSLNIGLLIKKKDEKYFATVQVPSVLSRIIELPSEDQERNFILLEQIIIMHLQKLFVGFEISESAVYRITRNADLDIDEEEAVDLLKEIEKSIKQRKWGEAIRLEISKGAPDEIVALLLDELELDDSYVYRINGPIDLSFLMKVYGYKGYESLKFPDFKPQMAKDILGVEDMFEAIKQKDIFLHHPFESFEPVVRLIQQAAKDENVLAIKQTLYRVSGQSPIVRALEEAAELGKQVTVLVELKARFDEENNIQWAKKLEKSGCHVIYGLIGLKTHSKITLIVRREDEGIRRYVHLGTGNYNDITARFYTDMGILTCNERIGSDASAVFNAISGFSETPRLYEISMAPVGLRSKFEELIRREMEHAKAGRKGQIIAKMNSFCDFDMAKLIYEAGAVGVEVDLIVRGINCMLPEVPGISDNIHVRSIVGKYLEHSRIYYFGNDGKPEIYLSSADWMPRNLNRRVELLFPILSDEIKERVTDILDVVLEDTLKAKELNAFGVYEKIDRRGKKTINSQAYFEEEAIEHNKMYQVELEIEVFKPAVSSQSHQED